MQCAQQASNDIFMGFNSSVRNGQHGFHGHWHPAHPFTNGIRQSKATTGSLVAQW
jgi:hypothetical protein